MNIKSCTEKFVESSGLAYTIFRLCGFHQVRGFKSVNFRQVTIALQVRVARGDKLQSRHMNNLKSADESILALFLDLLEARMRQSTEVLGKATHCLKPSKTGEGLLARALASQAVIGNYAVPILEDKPVWGTTDETRTAYLDSQVGLSFRRCAR